MNSDLIHRHMVLDVMRRNHQSGGRDADGDYVEGNYRERLYDDIMSIPPVTEQEPKSEWEHDHEILKAYSDGANEVLDKIRAEIEQIAKDYDKFADYRRVRGLWIAIKIIDKYKAESEENKK